MRPVLVRGFPPRPFPRGASCVGRTPPPPAAAARTLILMVIPSHIYRHANRVFFSQNNLPENGLRRANSTGTLFVDSTVSAPNKVRTTHHDTGAHGWVVAAVVVLAAGVMLAAVGLRGRWWDVGMWGGRSPCVYLAILSTAFQGGLIGGVKAASTPVLKCSPSHSFNPVK